VGSALNFAVCPGKVDELLEYVRDFVQSGAVSNDTGIAVYRGIAFAEESPYLKRVKTELLTVDDAEAEAARMGVRFIDSTGRKGRIGALGAVLWGNKGVEAAGLYGETL
ncbi:MAG: tRNA(Ile2) 2-agmatinylcytidine synthetase, partial [Methanoculleus sp.]|nr:tRNA(Ile2) 2-agmatinylcytidine synthetase [Methanoculleus sp.]